MQRFQGWLSRQNQRGRNRRDRLTRKIAHRLYLNRVARDREGDEKTDWARAEKLVRSPIVRTAFLFGEWWSDRVEAFESTWFEAGLEGLAHDLQNLAIIDLLNVLASLSLISGAIGYLLGGDERQKQTHYQAWQVINSAAGREAESGRKDAIEDLWADEVSLVGLDIHKANILRLDLSPHCYLVWFRVPDRICTLTNLPFIFRVGADLERANLQGAILEEANLQGASLERANLQRTILWEANLQETDLWEVNLQGASLEKANLQVAYLNKANLQGAFLNKANLQGAFLWEADLQVAYLRRANLQGADLEEANLQGADLWEAKLQGADLEEANLRNVIFLSTDLRVVANLVRKQLKGDEAPFICNSPVPKRFGIGKDRDCDRIPQVLVEKLPDRFPTIADAEEYVKNARQKRWD